MRRTSRLSMAAFLAAGALAMPATAGAHLDDDLGGTHPPTGGGAADQHSSNMTLLRNLPAVGGTQTDLAFQGRYAYAGTTSGFRVIDISNPAGATQVAFKACTGSQGDVSVYEDVLVQSVDTPQSSPGCNSTPLPNAQSPTAWEGVRIFDISDPTDPELIKSVRTDCGSHTNTLAPAGRGSLFVYVSSYALTTSSVGPNCEQFHGKISVVHIPLRNPDKSKVVAEPAVDVPDYESDRIQFPSPALQDTNGCHDITVLKPRNLAAAACLSVGQLWDISDRTSPKVIRTFVNENVGAWHSAQFTWDGNRVTFGDEAGGGLLPRCRAEDPSTVGALWTYDVATGAELGHYKLPRAETGICTMHNFNYVPGVQRDILVSSAYTGGTTVADNTDPANPVEIGFYRAGGPIAANTWSSYWHNGFVYANDISRGFDVFSLAHPSVAGAAQLDRDNPQTQERLFP
jgi:hypothetical protein